jgi:nucleoside-diphosphate-sugar epimerase
MHKVIKSLTNTQFEFDRKLFREVEGLNSFFDDVVERLEQRRDINPAFIDDITLLTSVTAKELPELKNLVKDLVWDYFDKCNFHTLSYMWAALCEEDPQMHQDITLVYTYRFIEAIIEAQHANVLTTETCSVIPELFMALRINNPEA